ncbi:MAG: DUF5063 domain-containing protein [Hyphomicrobiaceae bacterium]|nr:DUF5063 domain-containing protein [Hyphomicrobiaceae bacterium]
MPKIDDSAGTSTSVKEAVANFIVCIEGDFADDGARIAATARALDQLSLAYHDGADIENAPGEAEPPQREYQALRETVATRFPTLGYYATAPAGETLDTDVTVGDAIDDLTDIYSELQDVAWCFASTSPEDAVRLFRFGFAHHWGRHVCDVRGAIHFELFGM